MSVPELPVLGDYYQCPRRTAQSLYPPNTRVLCLRSTRPSSTLPGFHCDNTQTRRPRRPELRLCCTRYMQCRRVTLHIVRNPFRWGKWMLCRKKGKRRRHHALMLGIDSRVSCLGPAQCLTFLLHAAPPSRRHKAKTSKRACSLRPADVQTSGRLAEEVFSLNGLCLFTWQTADWYEVDMAI